MKKAILAMLVCSTLSMNSCITLFAIGMSKRKAAEKEAIENAQVFPDAKVSVQHLLTNDAVCYGTVCTRGTDWVTHFRITIIAQKDIKKGCTIAMRTDSPYVGNEGIPFKYYVPVTLAAGELFQEHLSTARTPYYRVIYQHYYAPLVDGISCE